MALWAPWLDVCPVDFLNSNVGTSPGASGPVVVLCGANSFDYLTELQRHARKLATNTAKVDAVELSRNVGDDVAL
jgi:hypothetical protein